MSAVDLIAKHGVDVPLPPPLVSRRCGVYLLIRKGRVIYVGKTNNIEERLRSHLHGLEGRLEPKVFDRAIWLEIDLGDIGAYQGALIRSFRPSFNTRLPALCGRDAEILARLGLPSHDERAVQTELHGKHGTKARRTKRGRS